MTHSLPLFTCRLNPHPYSGLNPQLVIGRDNITQEILPLVLYSRGIRLGHLYQDIRTQICGSEPSQETSAT